MENGRTVAVLSLVPWAAFMVTLPIAEVASGDGDVWLLPGLVLAAPFYVGFVALPAAFPIAVARHRATRIVAVLITTAAAIAAAILMTNSEDAKAGFEVFWLAYVAIPLGAAIWLAQLVLAKEESG